MTPTAEERWKSAPSACVCVCVLGEYDVKDTIFVAASLARTKTHRPHPVNKGHAFVLAFYVFPVFVT